MQNENEFATEKQDGEITKTVITNEFNFLNYIKFLALNLILILLPIIVFFGLMSRTKEDFWFTLTAVLIAVGIVILQYPILVLVKYWILKIGVFYLSMCLFFFIFGLINAWNVPAGGYDAGTWDARFHGGIVMIFFGHLFGFIFFPIVVLVNWLLRKQLFVYKEKI